MEDPNDRSLQIKTSRTYSAGIVDTLTTDYEHSINGSVLSNPSYSWVSCGPRLSCISSRDGAKRTGWTFGWAHNDPTLKVSCVEELSISVGSSILVLSCESENAGNSLCFYYSGSSRILKAIHFSEKVTSISVVSKSNEEEELSPLLKLFSGVIAIGTESGKVYLLDIWWYGLQQCIEDVHLRVYDEATQSKLLSMSLNDLEEIFTTPAAVNQGSSTLAVWLNEETLMGHRTMTHPGIQNILGRMPREFLSISALKYFPQNTSLFIGYNTSCFQIWNLATLDLLWTSGMLESMLPVFSFSLLEPSDDPRYVCYLWTFHHSEDEDTLPMAVMYHISYNKKVSKPQANKAVYKGFSSVLRRFEMELGVEVPNAVSGRIVSCQSIYRTNPKPSPLCLSAERDETAIEEGSASLLAVVWEVWLPDQPGTTAYSKLTLFDLNQWYREYMPDAPDRNSSRYMLHFCLPADDTLLDVKLIPNSVQQFSSLQPLDEHFYPSAFSFDCVWLSRRQVVWAHHVGVQRECLEALSAVGPSGLLLPAALYRRFCQAGVRPLAQDFTQSPTTHISPNKEQREYLLSCALEFGMVQYLRECARAWADGSHSVAGCTLPALLQWAWATVNTYKKRLDRLCVPLFDYSGIALDTNDLLVFEHLTIQLHRLYDLFRLVLSKHRNCIIVGNFEQQHVAIGSASGFYDAVLWCVRHKVLPETNVEVLNDLVPYFCDTITSETISRRAELHQLSKDSPSGLLLIDVMISLETGGSRITDQWEREGGLATQGQYPPPSIQSLLRIHLVRGVPAHVKHCIAMYLLLDVCNTATSAARISESLKHELLQYPAHFKLTESQSKIVEGFWCLDHKQFERGIDLLLDSDVSSDDLQAYHRAVLRLLMACQHHQLALHYLNIRRPGLMHHQDIKMKMSLLLSNNLIHQAFQFQREQNFNNDELLEQFFIGCVEMKKLDIIFKLPLNPAEEQAFLTFLDKTKHSQADDLKVYYLLSRFRYVDAVDMNEKLRVANMGMKQNLVGGLGALYSPSTRRGGLFGPRSETGAPAAVLSTRDLIINAVAKSLPSVIHQLTQYCANNNYTNWKQVPRPTPLSVTVHTDFSSDRLPFFKTSEKNIIQAAVAKTRENWAHLLQTPVALKRKHSSLHTLITENTPFLRTPVPSKISK